MPAEPPPRLVIDEVLPPEGKGKGAASPHRGDARTAAESEVARILAKWLDDFFRVPGTNFKLGLDPVISLIPGVGSSVASGGGLIIMLEAARSGVSFPVLVRMSGNMLVNTLFDFIPGVGPVASAFFKSNARNFALLRKWQAGQQHEVKKSTTRVLFVFAFIGLLMITLIALWFVALFWVISRLFGSGG